MSGNQSNGVQRNAGHGRAMCVVLHAPGTAVPPELITTIGRKFPSLCLFSDAYLAFAELCVSRKAGGIGLVLVEPAGIPDAADLIDAVRIHAPSAAVWWYSQHDELMLRRVKPGERADWSPPPGSPQPQAAPPPAAARGPRLAPAPGPETPRFKPGEAAAFRPTAKPSRPSNEPPRITVRPGGGIGVRRLRLVGDPLDSGRAKGPVPTPPSGKPAEGGLPAAPPDAGDSNTPEQVSLRAPMLTEEELRMLLSDELPDTTRGPGREKSGP